MCFALWIVKVKRNIKDIHLHTQVKLCVTNAASDKLIKTIAVPSNVAVETISYPFKSAISAMIFLRFSLIRLSLPWRRLPHSAV